MHTQHGFKAEYLGLKWEGQKMVKPNQPITFTELNKAVHFNIYPILDTGFEQFYLYGFRGPSFDGRLYFFHDCAYAILKGSIQNRDLTNKDGSWYYQNAWMTEPEFLAKEEHIEILKRNATWVTIALSYKIGCRHENMKHSNPRMFEHRLNCPDCGYTGGYDSSG